MISQALIDEYNAEADRWEDGLQVRFPFISWHVDRLEMADFELMTNPQTLLGSISIRASVRVNDQILEALHAISRVELDHIPYDTLVRVTANAIANAFSRELLRES